LLEGLLVLDAHTLIHDAVPIKGGWRAIQGVSSYTKGW
jgi:hypothetical protein